jgi:hypothetical protein
METKKGNLSQRNRIYGITYFRHSAVLASVSRFHCRKEAATPVVEWVKSDLYNLSYGHLSVVRMETIKRAKLSQRNRMYHLLGLLWGDHKRMNVQLQKQGNHTSCSMGQIWPIQPKLQPFECGKNGNNKKSESVTEESHVSLTRSALWWSQACQLSIAETRQPHQ